MKKLNGKVIRQDWKIYINLTNSDVKNLAINHIWWTTIFVDLLEVKPKAFSFPSKTRDLLDKTEIWV